jgi:alkaline phosphatase
MRRSLLMIILLGLLLTGCVSPPADNGVAILNTEVPAGDPTDSLAAVGPSPEAPTATFAPTPTFTLVPPTATLTASPEPTAVLPPGIILFIGDGMGANQRRAATWFASGEGGLLMMDNMPVHGSALAVTSDGNSIDSGASATSMAAGVVTYRLAVGVDANGNSVSTILELAQASGWAVGLVTTTSLTDATPAAFASHVSERSEREEIARQMLAHQVDVLLGGGEDDFFSVGQAGCFPGGGKQSSSLSLIEDAIAAGYSYVCSRDDLLALDYGQTDRVLGLFAADGMIRPYAPSLQEMTQAALSVLSRDPDGFLLVVEAGQIDWAAHENEAEGVIQLTLGLDAAVVYAQLFAFDRPNTLIIVTADHETGGMRLNLDGSGSYLQDGPFPMPDGRSFWVDWTSSSHTSERVPVTAQGPYSEMLIGEIPMTRLYETMYTYLVYGGLEN